MPERCDIAIVGAGPVGCALALALRAEGRSVCVLERRPHAAAGTEFRPIALSYASRILLERLGAWSALAATPIATIHVSQSTGPGRTELAAADARVPALGYVVEYARLAATLRGLAEASGARVLAGAEVDSRGARAEDIEIGWTHGEARRTLAARCLVHAEGASPQSRETRYGYDAVVARVQVEPHAAHTAFERFTAEGPLALLPLAGSYGAVWSARPERAAQLAACAPAEFLDALGRTAGARPGRFVAVAQRTVQPLALRRRASRIAAREVYIGNAAQTLHPVAGQGFNLGLRDAWDLACTWRGLADPGSAAALGRFAARRRLDAAAAIFVTDALARLFTGAAFPHGALRGAALCALDVLPGARGFFARRMIFGASALP